MVGEIGVVLYCLVYVDGVIVGVSLLILGVFVLGVGVGIVVVEEDVG